MQLEQKQHIINKLVYDYTSDIHKHIFEQLKFAEMKNNILLSIILAVCAVYAQFLLKDFQTIKLIPIAFLLISLFYILKAIYPKTSNTENLRCSPVSKNIYFFEYLCSIDRDEIVEMIKKKTDCKKITNDLQIKDLANQIQVLATITSNKHKNFVWSLRFFRVFLVCLVLVYLFAFTTQYCNLS